jgi:formate-dependent nitrite reductase membrane component NrfD
LFVTLSVTSGAALVALLLLATGKFNAESARLVRFILAFSLGVTLFLFLGLVQTMVYGSEELQQAWAAINGEFALRFWWLGLVVGVLIPLALAIGPMVLPQMEFATSPAMVTVTGVLGTIGAYTLREVIVYAGQLPQLYY